MKSQSDNLLAIVGGICEDIRRAYPTLKGLDLDLERLSHLVSSRGLGCFTLDLPALESKLLQGLKTGLLDTKGTTKYSKCYPVPRLFSGLYMRIFDRELCLKKDADINAIAFLRQILCLGKKIEVPCSKKRTFQTIEDYINVESSIIAPSLRWECDSLDCHSARNRVHFCDSLGPDLPLYPEYNIGRRAGEKLLLQRCQRVADYVAEQLGTFCPECFVEARRSEHRGLGLRHGPGAVAERGGRFFDKYRFTNWSAKLGALYPWETTGKMPLDTRLTPRNHEVPARLICVPKTAKGPRIIAAEPSEHMFTQNLFADWLLDRINDTFLGAFIDLKDQAKSGRLVLKASLDQSLATIDLSSASDRLSLWVIERMFRSNPSMLRAIHGTRTRWLRLPNGECIKLKKFASQGTALTFPLQTIAFLVIVLASCLDGPIDGNNMVKKLKNQVRVYGDDIIIPNPRYAETVELLSLLGLKVNDEKSFSTGNFRESCGVDAFKGYDVTPIKPKTTVSDDPASCQAVLDTANNLFYKGYWYASKQLELRQPPDSKFKNRVVGRGAGATGYGSFSFDSYVNRWFLQLSDIFESGRGSGDHAVCLSTSLWDRYYSHCNEIRKLLLLLGYRVRWNRRQHRIEVRCAAISSKTKERPYDCGYSGLLHRQLRPSNPRSLSARGFRGVPERPSLRKVTRWEPLENLFSRG